MKLNKEIIVITLLIIFAFLGLVLRNFPFSQGNFDKMMPPVITSYDLFANIDYASWIYESEDARYYNPSRIFGIENSLVQQPIFFHLYIATFGKIANLHPFQATSFITSILSILIILVFFIIVKRYFNTTLALITASFALIPHASLWFFQMNVGFLYDYYAFLFVPTILFFILFSIDQEYSNKEITLLGIIIGALISSQWLSHFVELFAFIPFFLLIILYLLLKKKLTKKFKWSFLSFTITFLPFLVYFYSLTRKAHLGSGFLGSIKDSIHLGKQLNWPSYFPHLNLSNILLLFLLIGSIFLIIFLINKKTTTHKKIFILFIIYLLVFGYSYLIGINEFRTIRQLFNGYFLIFFIFCTGIYYSITTLFKWIDNKILTVGLILLSIFPLFANFSGVYSELQQMDQNSFVNENKWIALQWIKDNINKSDFVFYLNGYFHEVEMLAGKPYYEGLHLPTIEYGQKNIISLCQGEYPDNYYGWWGAAEYHPELGGYIKSRKGLFNFEMIMPLQNVDPLLNYTFTKDKKSPDYVPLKFFDYIVLQYRNTEYNSCMNFFINESLRRGDKLVWSNPEIAIIKINKTLEL
ncbi:hypothetical protein HYV79_02115 [Candidatus Woesearchaeota archaeon]|nr:hypothetical protein [Candidatus Woesearchaeota archaeon]